MVILQTLNLLFESVSFNYMTAVMFFTALLIPIFSFLRLSK